MKICSFLNVLEAVFHKNKLEKALRALFTVGNGVAVIPYLYAAHQAGEKLFGSLPVSIIFDLATLWSNVLVYKDCNIDAAWI